MSSPTSSKSFMRQWGSLILSGVVILAIFLAFRVWSDYQAKQPIIAEYKQYLVFLSKNSPRARDFFNEHLAYNSGVVKAEDYQRVCALMTRMAQADGVDPKGFPAHAGSGCNFFSLY